MADFFEAFKITLGNEGGYVNDSSDAGGETYKGISRKYHGEWNGWVVIDSLKNAPNFPKNLDRDSSLQARVQSFYKMMYWDRFQGDQIQVQEIADELFDTGVNMGISRAVKFLQASLNYLNRNGELYPDMPDDGKLGPGTLKNLNIFLSKDSPDILYKIMNVLQANHYLEYMAKSPQQEKYCRGWFKRVEFKKAKK